jgi:hypothetical protein
VLSSGRHNSPLSRAAKKKWAICAPKAHFHEKNRTFF